MVFIRQQLLAPLAFRQESFVVLLSITPLLDGVLRLDIIAPFHTSGPPLLQFHLAIEQWGASGYAVTFPIALNVVYNVLSIPQTTASTSNAYWGRFYITALNKNGFNVSDTGAGSNRWIAIGSAQPQWGYYVESQNPTDYRYWSIPFTSHYITMATKTYYEPKEEAVPWLVGIDMQKFICGYGANFIGSSYVSCVGIGCQPQWGKTISGNNVKTKFPIAFTAFCMLSVSVNSSNGNAAESVFRNGFGYTNKTLSDWILRGPTSDATYFADYIAIGCQPQWGFTNNTGRPYITFPLKFSNVFTAISCICHNGSPSEANTVYNVSISGMNIGASGGGSGKYWCAFGVA